MASTRAVVLASGLVLVGLWVVGVGTAVLLAPGAGTGGLSTTTPTAGTLLVFCGIVTVGGGFAVCERSVERWPTPPLSADAVAERWEQ